MVTMCQTWDEIELSGVEYRGAEEAQENESADDSGFDETLVRPLVHHRTLQAAANVADSPANNQTT